MEASQRKTGKKIVEIDDSGWGDLLGGSFLVFNDVTHSTHTVVGIPVEYFQEEKFVNKEYLSKSRELVDGVMKELNINVGDECEFHICTGYVNNAVASGLIQLGFKVERCKIEGETQVLVEKAYEDYVKKLTGLENIPPSGKRFFALLKWVREDLENRERYVKSGWRSWSERWRTSETQKSYKACSNCKWLAYHGPHVGCYHNYKYHGWLPQKAIKTAINCPNWERQNG